jgi:sugar/nucleoside kinase (ribokinase family)
VWRADRPTPLVVPLRGAFASVPDSTGAGDAFTAGFLVAHTGGESLARAVRAGHRRARAHLRSLGAR